MQENNDIPNNEGYPQIHLQSSSSSQHQSQLQQQDNISTLVLNIKLYACLLIIEEPIPNQVLEVYKPIIIDQIIRFENNQSSQQLSSIQVQLLDALMYQYKATPSLPDFNTFANLDLFDNAIHQLYSIRLAKEVGTTNIIQPNKKKSSNPQLKKINIILNALWREMRQILEEDNFTIDKLENYQLYQDNIKPKQQAEQLNLENGHYRKQLINCDIIYPTDVYQYVHPPLHRIYVQEVTKVYDTIVPIKIKHIIPKQDGPNININNYYNEDIQPENAILCYPLPKSKTLVTYILKDISSLLTMEKEYMITVDLDIKWQFGQYTNIIVTPQGQIFGINCRTTKERIDPSIYEITFGKVSNRGKQIQPKRQCSLTYLDGCIYVIGGRGPHENCSARNFRYKIKQKKWEQITECNVAVRKPIVCTFGKYIFKLGGFNQFNYISKTIQMYDPNSNCWGIVRASPKTVLEQIQILQNSLAVQINDDEVYVFGGKNGNRISSDTAFVLRITEIRQRKKRAPKVSSELWNVSISNRNIFSYFGVFNQSNVVTYGNCIYALRSKLSSTIPPQL